MDKQRIISFDAEDSNGNVRVTIGDVNQFEEHRQYLIDAIPVLVERTFAVAAKCQMTPEQTELLVDAAERLADIEAMLSEHPL